MALFNKNTQVRLKSNPGKIGITTGNIINENNLSLIQVKFDGGLTFKPEDELEKFNENQSLSEILDFPNFGRVNDLKNIITHQKIKGNLTNIFYSMESSNTSFFPHQFIPVLKFIETPDSKLLLADEVGIGKTIEALYIWKELQARDNARRLLIICPAHLRTKWRNECKEKFNITAEIVDAKNLASKVQEFIKTGEPSEFALIASLQGLRPPKDWKEINNLSPRAIFARLCDDNPVVDNFSLFDLVIIDETHYLKNPTTSNYRLGKLVNDASNSSLLLSATPIQMKNDDLFNLIKLIYPDAFNDIYEFHDIFEDNSLVLKLQNNVGRVSPNLVSARELIQQIKQSPYFKNNSLVNDAYNILSTDDIINNKEKKVDLSRLLQKISLFSRYISRTRKRDTDEFKAERFAVPEKIQMNKIENDVYQFINKKIAEYYEGNRAQKLLLSSFARHLSSCFPATIKRWQNKGYLSTYNLEIDDEDQEIFNQNDEKLKFDTSKDEINVRLDNLSNINLKELEKFDSKYNRFLKIVRNQIKNYPNEKIVVFAFFTDTLAYLQRRLTEEENIKCLKIIGGLEDEEVDNIKYDFQYKNDSNILLSSKKGSEGIDLQFAHILINYDMPWNPMEVEQRIGRLDRLGQKAEKITIFNFFYKDTVDEKIYERLFNRIELFKNGIGDLEDILGDLRVPLNDLVSPFLSNKEREIKSLEIEQIIINKQKEQERVEKDGILLSAFSEYILNEINQSREKGRWLNPNEIQTYVCDFLNKYYPGTKINPLSDKNLLKIGLTDEAKTEFAIFLKNHKLKKNTILDHYDSKCLFDTKKIKLFKKDVEIIETNHPLIRWIKFQYDTIKPEFHKLSFIKCNNNSSLNLKSGEYFYLIYFISFDGYKKENYLLYQVIDKENNLISSNLSESLVNYASINGENIVHEKISYTLNLKNCFDKSNSQILKDFSIKKNIFDKENSNMCNLHEQRTKTFYNRKIKELNETINNIEKKLYNVNDDTDKKKITNTINQQRGKLKKRQNLLNLKLKEIELSKKSDTNLTDLSAGIIVLK